MPPSPVKVAIIGCGAVVELGHLPAAQLAADVEVTVLIDKDKDQAQSLAEKFEVAFVATDLSNLKEKADAAIIAVPHHLHAPIACECLEMGVPILIEKPMAMNPSECELIITAAERNETAVAVGMPRRFATSTQQIRKVLEAGTIGKIHSFSIESGSSESWPSRSLYLVRPGECGGGVLMANGCHDLDLALSLFGTPSEFVCSMDSLSRVESNCLITLKTESGIEGRIELSRTRNLKNTIRIEGEKGSIQAPLLGSSAELFLGNDLHATLKNRDRPTENPFLDSMARQLSAFASTVRGEESSSVEAAEGARVVQWIDECYREATLMQHSWKKPINHPALT